ncbi:hypothetical protein [Ruegeria arenilitoris]|uniref:hypothetical protein n=1 Tax=Ruegeria arenilitoris TaxID=1173585 RepID=UPI0014804DFA|nr:hypothetical protein [Ruegeria arenilitoris]
MKNRFFVGTALAATTAVVSACSTGENGETVAGFPGSPAWFATASTETKLAYYSAECKGYGFEPGTPDFAKCVKETAREMRAGANQSMANMSQQMSDFGKGPEMYTTNCNSFGNSINCRTTGW